MSEMAANIMSMFDKLSDEEQKTITEGLTKHLGTPVHFSVEELSSLSEEQLDLINKVLNGMILTKEKVPDMREAYEMLTGTDRPSRMSFGRIEDK
ncbi:MAG: hypothetical protein K0Q63_1479 [Paenibacillus sp.]|nr:hypothetical protein [Paenibacillus sp.]